MLKGRWGAARLAALARVPVIPLGLWGTEKVWPRSERAPRLWNVTHPPTVRVRVGEPVELKLRSPAGRHPAASWRPSATCCPPEAREPHDPTPEELALTFPPGHDGDDAAESSAARPGAD